LARASVKTLLATLALPGALPVSETDPDAALMLRVKEGDMDAFEQLVDKYKQPVLNVVYRMLHDATEAEDVAHTIHYVQHRLFVRSEEHTSELQSLAYLVCRLLLE